jgi:hypothetical protein
MGSDKEINDHGSQRIRSDQRCKNVTVHSHTPTGWTPVTRRITCTHSLQPVSPVENSSSAIGTICDTLTSESTLNQAEADISSEELLRMAECHCFYADRAIAAAKCKASSTLPEKNVVNKSTFKGVLSPLDT